MAVKSGSASVTIYRSRSKQGYDSFPVRYYRGTEEVRITRASFSEAHEEAQSAARSLANGELDVLTLRIGDRLSYVGATCVDKKVVAFCRFSSKRFAGRVLCRACQSSDGLGQFKI